jgi:hypothetical protein
MGSRALRQFAQLMLQAPDNVEGIDWCDGREALRAALERDNSAVLAGMADAAEADERVQR